MRLFKEKFVDAGAGVISGMPCELENSGPKDIQVEKRLCMTKFKSCVMNGRTE
jgi:hypothetical protein